MFGRKKVKEEIAEAIETRDALLAGVTEAVERVDDLKDELLRQYEQANGRQ